MATKISHKVQEYQTLRPYLGNIPKKKNNFPWIFGQFFTYPKQLQMILIKIEQNLSLSFFAMDRPMVHWLIVEWIVDSGELQWSVDIAPCR